MRRLVLVSNAGRCWVLFPLPLLRFSERWLLVVRGAGNNVAIQPGSHTPLTLFLTSSRCLTGAHRSCVQGGTITVLRGFYLYSLTRGYIRISPGYQFETESSSVDHSPGAGVSTPPIFDSWYWMTGLATPNTRRVVGALVILYVQMDWSLRGAFTCCKRLATVYVGGASASWHPTPEARHAWLRHRSDLYARNRRSRLDLG